MFWQLKYTFGQMHAPLVAAAAVTLLTYMCWFKRWEVQKGDRRTDQVIFVYLCRRKTAIAIDTIINQKRFNDGDDESKSRHDWELHGYWSRCLLGVAPQRRSCTVYMLPLGRREVQWLRSSSGFQIQVCCWALNRILRPFHHPSPHRCHEVHHSGECHCI